MKSTIIILIIILTALCTVHAVPLMSNPCHPDATCRTGAPNDRCGYGSTCVGPDLESGKCELPDAVLTCSENCDLFNSTSLTIHSNQTCDQAACSKTSASTVTTCGLAGDKWAPFQCDCSPDGACNSGSCVLGQCSLTGLGLMSTGMTCATAADCISGICTDNVCIGRAEGVACNRLDSTQCAHGLACSTPSPRLCRPRANIGAACSTDIQCVDYGYCERTSWTCMNLFAATDGQTCDARSNCAPGLGCINGFCSTEPRCDSVQGSLTCAYGQTCGCSDIDPVCTGAVIPTTCANAIIAYEKCIYDHTTIRSMSTQASSNTRFSMALAPNFIPTPVQCMLAFQELICNEQCSANGATWLKEERNVFIDYNLIDCDAGRFSDYSPTQPEWCSRSYCPAKFNYFPANPSSSSTGAASSSSTAHVSSATSRYPSSIFSEYGATDAIGDFVTVFGQGLSDVFRGVIGLANSAWQVLTRDE